MMQYINTNADDEGFVVHLPDHDGVAKHNERFYYVHEVKMDMMILLCKQTKLSLR